MRVEREGSLESGEDGGDKLAAVDQGVQRGALYRVSIDVPSPHQRRRAVARSVTPAGVEDMHASGFEEADLIL